MSGPVEQVASLRAIVHAIWSAIHVPGSYRVIVGEYAIGFYIRHEASGADLYRHELLIRGGFDPKLGRDVFSIESFEDPEEEGEVPA